MNILGKIFITYILITQYIHQLMMDNICEVDIIVLYNVHIQVNSFS